jgi:hypothetical protein
MARKKPDLNDLRLCVDRPIPETSTMDAAVLAMAENNENAPPDLIIRPGAVVHPFEMALFTTKKWANGRKVGVRFLDGSKKQKTQTQKYAEVWEQHANVNFDFSAGTKAEIRISFKERGSWSALGTDCLAADFPKNRPTMNYGWLKDDSDEKEWRRVVLHEFGHALGAIHEHQNPAGGIKWNLPEVYRVFSGPPNNWDKAKIDFNIVQKYSMSQLNATKYDKKSIMLYAFPGNLIVGGKATQSNTDISAQDEKFIAEMYPPAAPAAAMALEGLAAPMIPIRKAKKAVVTAATFAEIVRDLASSRTPAGRARPIR